MRVQFTLVFVWLLALKLRTVRTDVILSNNETTSTNLLLARVLQDADVTHNFLVAPHEMRQLLARLRHGRKIETSSDNYLNSNVVETPFERYFTPLTHSITVSNTLKDAPADSTVAKAAISAANQELLNAVAISARWSINFQKRDTHKRQFYMAPHDAVYTDAMRKDDIFQYAEIEELNARAIALPLQRSALRLLILLPNEQSGLQQLTSQLSRNLSLVEEIFTQRLRPELVRIFIPKFKFTFKIDVKEIFKEYATATTTSAEHTAFLNDISKISHQAYISIGEKGIGDLERTTVLFWNAFSSVRSTPINFDIDRPFVFVIRNEQGIQFYGHLARL